MSAEFTLITLVQYSSCCDESHFFILIREIVTCLFYFSKIRLHAQMLQLCLTLCNTVDCSQPGSSVHGIVLARILQWVVIPFSRGSLWPRDLTCVSCITGRLLIIESPRKPNRRVTILNSTFIWWWHQFNSVQSLNCVWLFVTLWTAARQASLSITNSQSLLKLMSIELVMLSKHPILCCPFFLPLSIFSSIRVFSNESVLCIRWPKYWSFSFSIKWASNTSNEYPGLSSSRMDWLDLLAV